MIQIKKKITVKMNLLLHKIYVTFKYLSITKRVFHNINIFINTVTVFNPNI